MHRLAVALVLAIPLLGAAGSHDADAARPGPTRGDPDRCTAPTPAGRTILALSGDTGPSTMRQSRPFRLCGPFTLVYGVQVHQDTRGVAGPNAFSVAVLPRADVGVVVEGGVPPQGLNGEQPLLQVDCRRGCSLRIAASGVRWTISVVSGTHR